VRINCLRSSATQTRQFGGVVTLFCLKEVKGQCRAHLMRWSRLEPVVVKIMDQLAIQDPRFCDKEGGVSGQCKYMMYICSVTLT
jgi:hypothetical protein